MELKENWAVWSIVTLAATLITAYANLHAPSAANGAALARIPAPLPDLTSSFEPALKAAVRNADQSEILAGRLLDPRPLYDSFMGEALQAELNGLTSLRSQGIHALADLTDVAFTSLKVEPDTLHARVDVTETWNNVYYDSDGQCVGKRFDVLPQTLFLVRKGDRWLVSVEDHHPHVSAPLQSCS